MPDVLLPSVLLNRVHFVNTVSLCPHLELSQSLFSVVCLNCRACRLCRRVLLRDYRWQFARRRWPGKYSTPRETVSARPRCPRSRRARSRTRNEYTENERFVQPLPHTHAPLPPRDPEAAVRRPLQSCLRLRLWTGRFPVAAAQREASRCQAQIALPSEMNPSRTPSRSA